VRSEDQGYIAKAVDLKGCSAFGETPEQALKEMETAVELWLSVAKMDHHHNPDTCLIRQISPL
jgi:predicted RNase H-like HicB family nuclease